MAEQSEPIDDESGTVEAPCNTCAFAYPRRKGVRTANTVSERDIYRMGSKRPGCAYYVSGVPMEILKSRTKCVRYAEKREVEM